jgi:hypothetical protein
LALRAASIVETSKVRRAGHEMSESRSDSVKKVALEEALRSITNTIVKTAEQAGLDTESLNLEMQFSLDVNGDRIEPVVYAGVVPSDVAVHRVSFRVGVNSVDSESERVRRELEALTGGGEDEEVDSNEIDIDDQPPKLRRRESDGVLAGEARRGSRKEIDSPRIIVPAKPVLKLRHASDIAKQKRAESNDERQARHFERDYSIPETQRAYEAAQGEERHRMATPSRKFVIFDHQRVQGRLDVDGVLVDDVPPADIDV